MNQEIESIRVGFVFVCLFATGLKKAKTEGKKCHDKTMKSKRNSQIRTLHAPLRQNTEEKRQGKEL